MAERPSPLELIKQRIQELEKRIKEYEDWIRRCEIAGIDVTEHRRRLMEYKRQLERLKRAFEQ